MPQRSPAFPKIAVSAVFVIALVSYLAWRFSGDAAPVVARQDPPAMPAMMQQQKSRYADGSYVGKTVDAFYGIVQVKAVIKDGKLTDVKFLSYPNDQEHSLELSQQSLPILAQEAIAAQNAQVDIVSGATQTSEAFRTSLADALAVARG